MRPKALTTVQFKLLQFIAQQLKKRGFPPSYREIMVEFGWRSTNNVDEHLWRMHRKGAVDVGQPALKRRIRSIRITDHGWAILDMRPKSFARIIEVTRPWTCTSCGVNFYGNDCPMCAIDNPRHCATM